MQTGGIRPAAAGSGMRRDGFEIFLGAGKKTGKYPQVIGYAWPFCAQTPGIRPSARPKRLAERRHLPRNPHRFRERKNPLCWNRGSDGSDVLGISEVSDASDVSDVSDVSGPSGTSTPSAMPGDTEVPHIHVPELQIEADAINMAQVSINGLIGQLGCFALQPFLQIHADPAGIPRIDDDMVPVVGRGTQFYEASILFHIIFCSRQTHC